MMANRFHLLATGAAVLLAGSVHAGPMTPMETGSAALARATGSPYDTADPAGRRFGQDSTVKCLKDRDGRTTDDSSVIGKQEPEVAALVRGLMRAGAAGTPSLPHSYEYVHGFPREKAKEDRFIIAISDAPTKTTYNRDGYPLSITTAQGTTTFAYDDQDRLIRKTTPTETTNLTYDARGGKVSALS